jgi:NADH-quinone oxidoreductase subunit E
MIPESLKKDLASRIAHAVTPREAAVDVMKELQRHYGWLTDDAVVEAAELLDLSPLQVEELATFYEMIYRRPVGKKVIHVCDSISCWSVGGDTLMAHLAALLGVRPGQVTLDGQFTILPCACLGNCGDGPTMMIGERIYGKITADALVEILEREKTTLPALAKKEAP